MIGMLVCAGASAQAQKLKSPWDGLHRSLSDSPYACPAAPMFGNTLDIDGYYTDKQYSVIDPKKLEAFNAASEGPTHLGQYASRAADAYLATGSRAAAACVYSLLDAAAKADAWDGKMPNLVGVYMQNWMLSGTAIAYLKARDSGAGSAEQDREIQKWFAVAARRVREYFDVQRTRPGSDAFNNHMYWAGLAVAAEGVADDDRDAFRWGLETYRMGVDAIQPNGTLTAEMNRGQRALHYHLYALGPLIILAEFGEANGMDLYAADGGAIQRLVKFCTAGLVDPSMVEKRTGAKQVVSLPYSGLDIGWAVPYVKRFSDAQLSALLAKAQWTGFWQWGGLPPD
jgi:poly(beta-D-mannuronate) lyase